MRWKINSYYFAGYVSLSFAKYYCDRSTFIEKLQEDKNGFLITVGPSAISWVFTGVIWLKCFFIFFCRENIEWHCQKCMYCVYIRVIFILLMLLFSCLFESLSRFTVNSSTSQVVPGELVPKAILTLTLTITITLT